ncbi:hypothetical protein KKF05_04775 [Patescibacteria group bacterium]|nr:hypothetical protein [Patescibacteria group bacterium]
MPVYRSITLAMLLVGALLLMAAIMSACWNNSPWPRRILTIFAVCAISGLIFQLSAPSAYHSIRNWTVSLVDGVTSWGDRQNRVVEVEREAVEREDVQDAQRLDIVRARQAEIRQRVLDENCTGAFCTPEDRDEYRRLQREAEQLIAGTRRDSEPPTPTKAPAVQPAPSPRAAGASHLPPPPPVDRSGDAASSRRHRPRSPAAKRGSPARGSSGLPRVTNDELDDIFFPIHQ